MDASASIGSRLTEVCHSGTELVLTLDCRSSNGLKLRATSTRGLVGLFVLLLPKSFPLVSGVSQFLLRVHILGLFEGFDSLCMQRWRLVLAISIEASILLLRWLCNQ